MLGIDCLKLNPELKGELKDLVEVIGWDIAAGRTNPLTGSPYKMSASITNVYRQMRKMGIEIDGQTLSHLYGEVFQSDERFSQEPELEDFRNESYRNLIAAEADMMKTREIGKDNAVTSVVSTLMRQVKLISDTNTSVQKLFQERLLKAAKRVAGFKSENSENKKSAADILREVLLLENNNTFPGDYKGSPFSAMENARTLWREFKKEFNDMAEILEAKDDVYNAEKIRQYADILEGATYKFLMSSAEAQKVINETLKDAGYSKEVKSGGVTRQIVDWNKVFNDTEFDFTETIKKVFRDKGFTEPQLDRISEEMQDEWDRVKALKMERALDVKNKPSMPKPQKSAIKKVQNLYNLGIFEKANQTALFKALGIGSATTAQINQLQQLMALNNKALSSPLEEWSETYVKTIQRDIEIIIEQSEENRDAIVKLIRKWGFFNQLGSALVLSNPQNTVENITSGAFQTIITTLFTQPRHAARTFGTMYTAFKDVIRGGVRVGQERGNTFNSSGVYEDRYNFETAKTLGQKAAAAGGLLARAVLSAPDNAYKTALINQIAIDTFKSELIRQGATPAEANTIINEALYANEQVLRDAAKAMAAGLDGSGVKINSKIKEERIYNELVWANLASDGQFFPDIIKALVDNGKVRPDAIEGVDTVFLKQILKGAEVAASRGLGHEADSWTLSLLDALSRYIGTNVSQARKKGYGLDKAIGIQTAFGIANRYAYGGLRWMWLTIEKTSGLAFLQTVITDLAVPGIRSGLKTGNWGRLFNQYASRPIDINDGNSLQTDNDKARRINERGDAIARYASLKQRLIRETVGPIFSYAMLMVVQAVFAGGGDDDDKKEQLIDMAVNIRGDKTLTRWAQKTFPPAMFNYIMSLAKIKNGKIVEVDSDSFDLPSDDVLGYFFGGRAITNITETFKNNFNQSGIDRLTKSLMDVADGKQNAEGVFGEALLNAVLSNPVKAFDIYRNSLMKQPLLNDSNRKALKAEDMKEGILKGLAPEGVWNNYKDVDLDKKWLWD